MKIQLSKEICFALALACGPFVLLGCENKRAEPSAAILDAASPGDAVDLLAKAPTADRVLVLVNAAPIYESDLNSSLTQASAGLMGAATDGDEASKKLAGQVLEKLVQDELLIQDARHRGLFVTDEEIDARLSMMIEAGGGATAFQAFMERSGLPADRLRANLARNLLIERLIESLRTGLNIDDGQLRAFYQKSLDRLSKPVELELAQIEFGRSEDAQKNARSARDRIAAGLEFEKAANLFGTGKRVQGLGTFRPDDLLPVFAKAVEGLEAGQVSAPVDGPAGIVLLRVVGRSDGSVPAFETVRERLGRELAAELVQKSLKELTDRLAREANIQRHDLP